MAQVNAVSDPVHEGNPVSNARTRIESATERVQGAARTLRGIADELYGGLPEGGEGSNKGCRAGEFGILHDQIDGLIGAITGMEDQLARLSALSPAPCTAISGGTR